MLSDEEKEALEILKLYFGDNPTLNITKYVNIVLNLIEKQSKEIKELKEKNYYLPAWVEKKYVSKDKIKAKIEDYKEKCKNCNFRGKICKEFTKNYNCTIAECLKEFYSLLEKE